MPVIFQTAALATPPDATQVATDTVSGSEYQHMKIALGPTNTLDELLEGGQQVASKSLPIVIASDQSAIPITVASLPLPTGAATLAAQLPDGHNVTIDNVSVVVDGSGVTQPISAVALPLPTGASIAANQLPDGHNVTVDNVSIVVDGSAVTQPISAVALPLPSGAATSALQIPIYTEDDIGVANPIGSQPVMLRQDTPTILVSLDGDVVAQRATNYGAAYVQVVDSSGNFVNSFGGSGGTSHADDATFTIGSASSITPIGLLADETGPPAVSEGFVGLPRMTLSRKPYAVITDPTSENNAAVDGSGNLQIDIAASSATVAVSAASLPLPTGAATSALQLPDGHNVTVDNASIVVTATQLDIDDLTFASDKVDASGTTLGTNTGVNIGTVDVASVIPGTGPTNLGKAEDAGHTSGDVGIMPLAVLLNSPLDGGFSTTDTDYVPLAVTNQRLQVTPNIVQLFDNFSDHTSWTALNDDADTIADETTNYLAAGSAVSFNKADGTANTVFALINKTLGSPVNILNGITGSAFLQVVIRIPSVVDVVNLVLRLGTDSTNYGEWKIDATGAPVNEFVTFRMPVTSQTSAVGTGWSGSAIDYVAVGLEFSNESDTLPGIVIDAIIYNGGNVVEADITSQASPATTNINVQKIGGTATSKGTGTATNGSQRIVIATDDINLAAINLSLASTLTVDGSGVTQPISAVALPLPTGAATSAGQLADGHNVTVDNADLTVVNAGTFAVQISAVTPDLMLGTDYSTVMGVAALNTTAVLADAVPTSQDVLNVRNFNYVYNGATFDLVREGGTAGSILVDGSAVTQPISVASLPLPTGAATSANQLADGHNVTVDNAAGGSAVNIQDGGNSITIDAVSLPLPTGAATAANQLADGHNVTVDNASLATTNAIVDGWDNGASDGASVSGDVLHDTADAGEPVKIGARAIDYKAAETAVADQDRTDLFATREGLLWTLGGSPDAITVRLNATGAQTDVAIVTVSAGTAIVVTRATATVDNANSVDVACRIGFGTANTPTTTGTVLSHPGIAPGSGEVEGNGGGVLGVGLTNEDLRVTSEVPTGGSLDIVITYHLVVI